MTGILESLQYLIVLSLTRTLNLFNVPIMTCTMIFSYTGTKDTIQSVTNFPTKPILLCYSSLTNPLPASQPSYSCSSQPANSVALSKRKHNINNPLLQRQPHTHRISSPPANSDTHSRNHAFHSYSPCPFPETLRGSHPSRH
jgi:hypothetical protein